jgi:adenylosuccinate lyase
MAENLDSLGGVVHSGEALLRLARAGFPREAAYEIVQRNAMKTWDGLGAGGKSFRENLIADPEVAGRVSPAEIDAAMDPAIHLQHLDRIFARVFGES